MSTLLSFVTDYEKGIFPNSKQSIETTVIYEIGSYVWQIHRFCLGDLQGLNYNIKLKETFIVNAKSDKTVCLDRKIIARAGPVASDELGKLAAITLLKEQN